MAMSLRRRLDIPPSSDFSNDFETSSPCTYCATRLCDSAQDEHGFKRATPPRIVSRIFTGIPSSYIQIPSCSYRTSFDLHINKAFESATGGRLLRCSMQGTPPTRVLSAFNTKRCQFGEMSGSSDACNARMG